MEQKKNGLSPRINLNQQLFSLFS